MMHGRDLQISFDIPAGNPKLFAPPVNYRLWNRWMV
jgi:hypothetical protein